MAYHTGDRPAAQRRRVAVTGVGIITPMGTGWDANAAGFRAGNSALREIDLFDVSRQRIGRGGQLDLPAELPATTLTPRDQSRVDRASAMLLHAGREALEGAGWIGSDVQAPLVLGTSAGAMTLGQDYFLAAREGSRRGQITRVEGYQTQRQARYLCDAFGVSGPVTIISNACSSGANAIGEAFGLLATGRAERVFAGGYDALCQLVFAGFDSLQALSTTTPRPFAADRDGLALGEGAAMFCLEPLDAAKARGAQVAAEVVGYGTATDRHHLTQPNPEGDAALASMSAACGVAGLEPGDIGYINSHGTGTPLNDVAEANAITRWAGDAARDIAVSSTKGGIGHLLGGAGAVEAAICLMALTGGWIPPNVPIDNLDPACGFDLVTSPRDAELHAVLTNSFGFGGANATLILRKTDTA
jgi:3-oxoacyl-[acyl-carrier-protein] synthase II